MEKMEKLTSTLATMAKEGLAVAFSGGVDSSLLLYLACRTGYPVAAVTLDSPLSAVGDLAAAERVATECGAKLTVLSVDVSQTPEIMMNDRRRCYFCKKRMFETMQSYCDEHRIVHIIDGTNRDDLDVYRPGLAALKEMGIRSPLAECGFRKSDVRELAATLGLSVAARPAGPCMATRLPYNTPLDFDVLRRLAQGEATLRALGFATCRLRLHGQVLRIEVPPEQIGNLVRQKSAVISAMRAQKFPYITIDLEGFRSGSMDLEEEDG